MSHRVGKEYTVSKVQTILMDLIKDDNADVKLNVVSGMKNVAKVIGAEILT